MKEKILALLAKLESHSKLHIKNNINSLFIENEERENIFKLIIESFLHFNLNICYSYLKNK